jgi:hypothetical protein
MAELFQVIFKKTMEESIMQCEFLIVPVSQRNTVPYATKKLSEQKEKGQGTKILTCKKKMPFVF